MIKMTKHIATCTGNIILIGTMLSACGGSTGTPPIPTSAVTPSPTPTPTAEPIETSITVQAESMSLLGNAAVMEDSNASGELVVGNFSSSGDGVQYTNPPESIGISISYNADAAMALALQSASRATPFLLSQTPDESLANASIEFPIFAGEEISLTYLSGSDSLRIDSITFLGSPLQVVSTLVNIGFTGGDGVSVSASGDIFVSRGLDAGTIVQVTPDGNVSTFATGFSSANGSDFDSEGNLFVADYSGNRVVKISPEGEVGNFATELNGPASVYIDENDQVYVGIFGAGFSGNGASVLRFQADGTQEVYASGGGLLDVIGITEDSNGEIYAGNWTSGQLYRITEGNVTLFADLDIRINQIDYSRGYIYVANNNQIHRVSILGNVSHFSGSSTSQTINDHIDHADFSGANSLDFSPDENRLYVYDAASGNIRVISRD